MNREPVLYDDEDVTAYLANVSPDLPVDEVQAMMTRLAVTDWGLRVGFEQPRLLWLCEDPENEEAMQDCSPDHPDAVPVWTAEFGTLDEPSAR